MVIKNQTIKLEALVCLAKKPSQNGEGKQNKCHYALFFHNCKQIFQNSYKGAK